MKSKYMNDELSQKHTQQLADFAQAVARLREGLASCRSELERDGAIQRFEFCTDLAWKTLKTRLRLAHNIECASPRTCVREAFAVSLIQDNDPFWLTMLDMRNLASHTSDQALAEELFGKLPDALKRFESLLVELNKTNA
jgi:nucleotidyltransferase substrate binding protein (TIGR01987 family)